MTNFDYNKNSQLEAVRLRRSYFQRLNNVNEVRRLNILERNILDENAAFNEAMNDLTIEIRQTFLTGRVIFIFQRLLEQIWFLVPDIINKTIASRSIEDAKIQAHALITDVI